MLSLGELRSPNFNLLSNQEYSEEEIMETMVDAMEQYMSKTRVDYGSGVARPKIENNDNFELKGQFLKGAIPSKTTADAKIAIQEMAEYSLKWHNRTSKSKSTETSDGLAAVQAQLNNLGREIKKVNEKVYAAQVGCEQCKGPHYTNDCPLKEEWKTLEEAYYTKEYLEVYLAQLKRIREIKSSRFLLLLKLIDARYAVLDLLNTSLMFTARAKIDVYKRKITLRVGEEKVVFTSVKPASRLIKRVYMLSLRERIELDLEARLMGETLVLNQSLDLFFKNYIRSNDLNKPNEIRRNQGNDLMPTIEEGEVIEEFRTKNGDVDIGINDYPSYYDYDKKIHIDCTHNLKFSCIIGFEFTHANFFPLLYVNVMSKKFHNSIIKDKMEYKGNNVIKTLTNLPIFVETFSVVTDFAVLKNMDAYRDKEIGDVIVDKPFSREVGVKTRRFEGTITLYKDDKSVTYQMVPSHPRFKCHTNEQCNKISPLLKVSDDDMITVILHPY
nr:hypothetical protein [Tanacetum cinerariifolium]